MLWTLAVRLLGFFSGDAMSRLAAAAADFYRTRADAPLARHRTEIAADSRIALATIEADLAARRIQQQVLQADRGWWVTAWIRPLLVYPCVAHFGAIMLDSTFALHWGIAKLPAPYDGYEQAIILSFFIARPFEKVARVFVAGRG